MTQDSRAVIWDVDGTLIDSADAHWQSWRVIFAEEGMPDLSYEKFLTWFGRRNEDIIRESFDPDIPLEEAHAIAQRKEDHYLEGLRTTPTPILPGVEMWLERLARDGWLLAIGTSAATTNIDIILQQSGWTHVFGAVVTREQVSRGKPDPEVFLTAASRLGVSPSQAIVVEDAAAGILGAHRAGMRTIGTGATWDSIGAMIATPSLDELPPDTFDTLLVTPVSAAR